MLYNTVSNTSHSSSQSKPPKCDSIVDYTKSMTLTSDSYIHTMEQLKIQREGASNEKERKRLEREESKKRKAEERKQKVVEREQEASK